MPPVIVDVFNDFRAQLLRQEEAAMREMAGRWLQVEQALSTSMDALTLELANEGVATAEQLMRSRRFQSLMVQTRAELKHYERYLQPRIESGQRNMITAAIQHSETAVQALATEAQITVPWNRLPVRNVEGMVGLAGDGSPLADVLADASTAGAEGMRAQLVRGIALGVNPREVARQAIRLGLGTAYTRMATISRSEMLRVYRLTTLESYANSRVVTGYRRLSARDDRVCPACLFADGNEYQINEGFDAHVNCVVGGTVVSSPAILATSKRWFDGQVIEIRTVNGNVLTVTENHPILTDKGWVAAHLLQEGDNVISSLDGERTVALVDPNDYSRPTVIEDVLESFARTGGMIPVSVPTSPVDFHGDGMHGNVDIVRADSFLDGRRQAAFGQPGGEQSFIISSMGQGLFLADSAVAKLLEGALLTTRCNMHGRSKPGDFFGGALASQESISLGLAADGYAGFHQAAANDGADGVIGGGESVLGFTGQITGDDLGYGQPDAPAISRYPALFQITEQCSIADAVTLSDDSRAIPGNVIADRVVNLVRRQFSGHVYNLQTGTGWYIAGGIITHNCRCTLIPVLRNVPPIRYETGREWFARQPEGTQLEILGRGRFDLWRRGEASLDDMVSRDWSDTWGGSLRVTRVRDLG